MLILTQNLGSIPEFCDRKMLIKGTVSAHRATETTFNRLNLENDFNSVLNYFTLISENLHDDKDARSITVFTDDKRPLVQYDY